MCSITPVLFSALEVSIIITIKCSTSGYGKAGIHRARNVCKVVVRTVQHE